ncbi:MAG TPA: complex I subunit 1 family protein, partial [Pirellulales bacterium]|nr:complex I subunit 1 family protein [Pirellulales bacterium]
FHTEYSGLRWSYFFMAEYGSMFAVSGLAAILFFGGWNGPLPITSWLGLVPENGPVLAYIGNFIGMLNFVFKCVAWVTFMIWVRWTLPRLRIDQVMKVCLKYCTPIASVMFLGAVFWTYLLPGGVGLRARPYAEYEPAPPGRGFIAAPVADQSRAGSQPRAGSQLSGAKLPGPTPSGEIARKEG